MISVSDPAQVGQEKIALENNSILPMVFAVFPNHRLSSPTHPYRDYYTVWVLSDEPCRSYTKDLDIRQTQFGILRPEPEDNRPQLFGIRFGWKEPAELIANIIIKYHHNTVTIEKISIEVFGKKNKKASIELGLLLERLTQNIEITVFSQETRYENESYRST